MNIANIYRHTEHGVVFYTDAPETNPKGSTLKVICPTANKLAVYGGPSDGTVPVSERVVAVRCRRHAVEVVTGNYQCFRLPVSLTGGKPIRICESDKENTRFWTWSEEDGETYLKAWYAEHGKLVLKVVFIFIDDVDIYRIDDDEKLNAPLESTHRWTAEHIRAILEAEPGIDLTKH